MGSVPVSISRLLAVAAVIEVIAAPLGLLIMMLSEGGMMVVSVAVSAAVSVAMNVAVSAITALLFFFEEDANAAFYVGCALFLAGPIFFGITYMRYRNQGERHYHERETPVRMENLQVYDTFERHLVKQESSRIAGANDRQVKGSLVQGGALGSVAEAFESALPSGSGDLLKKLK
jgi:hypothetical protein